MPTSNEYFASTAKRKTKPNKRAQHEGRLPEAGVPQGPRNTYEPPKKTKTKKSSSAMPKPKVPAPSRGKPNPHTGGHLKPADVLKKFEEISGMSTPEALSPGSKVSHVARHVIAEEAENLAKQAKKNLTPSSTGGSKSYESPTWDEAKAAAAITTPADIAATVDVAPKISTKLAKTADALLNDAKAAPKKAVEKAAQKVEDVRTAPKRAAAKAKALPREAKEAASSPAGRKAAAKGAAKAAAKRPVKTGYAGALAVPTGAVPGDVGKRARALATGGWDAATQNPLKTAATTGKGVLGSFAFPVAVGAAGVESVKKGSLEPLEATVEETGKGLLDTGKKLASGNPKIVQKSVENEVGAAPLIPLPAVGRYLKDTETAGEIRDYAREKVGSRRQRTRTKREAAQEKAAANGRPYRGREPKAPVVDPKTGQEYASRLAGKFKNKQASRHAAARAAGRGRESGTSWADLATKDFFKELRKSKHVPHNRLHIHIKGKPRQMDAGDAVAFVADHGIPKNKERGEAATQEALTNYGEFKHGSADPSEILDRHSAQWLLDHPDIWKDDHFWNAVKIFKKIQEEVGTSPRHRWLSSADNIVNPRLLREGKNRVLKPEEQITPRAEKFLRRAFPQHGGQWDRTQAWDVIDGFRKGGKRKAADFLEEQMKAKDANGDFVHLMKPEEHGGAEHGVSATEALPWTPQMVTNFDRQMRQQHKRMGLDEPAAHVAKAAASGLSKADRAQEFTHLSSTVHASQGKLGASGNAMSSLESLYSNSIHAPRVLRRFAEEMSGGIEHHTAKINGRLEHTAAEAEHLINTNRVPDGYIPVDLQAIKGTLTSEHGLTPDQTLEKLRGTLKLGGRNHNKPQGEELRGEIMAMAKAGVKGRKYAFVHAPYIKETFGQLEQINILSRGLAHVGNFSTRAILNTPARLLVQFPQEGIPMIVGAGKNAVHIPSAIKTIFRLRKEFDEHPEMNARLKSVVGSNAGVQGIPYGLRKVLDDPISAAAPKTAWRHAWELINGTKAGHLDRERAGWMREVGAAAKVHGDFKSFNTWREGAQNIFKGLEDAHEAMKGMTEEERLAYATSHPELADRLQVGMNQWMGNWNTFTAFEKQIAPISLFYSFQRYSALWMLYHFPLNHPVAATALTFLGEQNAKQLDELAKASGGEITNPLDYTLPVVRTAKGKVSPQNAFALPVGTRNFPGLNAAAEGGIQAATEGKLSQVAGMVQPSIEAAGAVVYGTDPYSGEPIKENPLAYLANQFISQSGAVREAQHLTGWRGFDKDPQSGISKAFEILGQDKTTRSVGNPYSGQSGRNFGLQTKLETGLKRAKDNSEDRMKELAHEGKLPPKRKAQMEAASERGGKEIDQVLHAIDKAHGTHLVKQSEEEFERTKEQLYYTPPKGKAKVAQELGLEAPPTKKELEEELGLESPPSKEELAKELGLVP